MGRRKKFIPSAESMKFQREYDIIVDGFSISAGDIIKIKGEHGTKFRFDSFVTNTETGAQWIDCFEVHRNSAGAYRSFKLDKVKRVPQKGKRSKRVV